jgi:hypothetical protein
MNVLYPETITGAHNGIGIMALKNFFAYQIYIFGAVFQHSCQIYSNPRLLTNPDRYSTSSADIIYDFLQK